MEHDAQAALTVVASTISPASSSASDGAASAATPDAENGMVAPLRFTKTFLYTGGNADCPMSPVGGREAIAPSPRWRMPSGAERDGAELSGGRA